MAVSPCSGATCEAPSCKTTVKPSHVVCGGGVVVLVLVLVAPVVAVVIVMVVMVVEK